MGGCGSKVTEEEKASRTLQAEHEAAFNEDKRKIKLLLLGAWRVARASGCNTARFAG